MTCRASSSLTGALPQCHVIPKLRQFVKFLAVLSVCLQWPYLHSTECRGRCLWSRAPAVLRGPTGQTRRGNRAKRCHVGGPISPCPRELATHCKARKQGQRRRRQRGSVRVCHVIKLLTLSVNLSLIWHSCKLKPEIQAPLPFFKKKILPWRNWWKERWWTCTRLYNAKTSSLKNPQHCSGHQGNNSKSIICYVFPFWVINTSVWPLCGLKINVG